MIPSAPGTLRKKECSPFDKKCIDKLKVSMFRKKKPKQKGKPPPFTGGTKGLATAQTEVKPKETDREFQYTVTYPSGETKLLKEKRDTSVSLQEQIKKARARALAQRAAQQEN